MYDIFKKSIFELKIYLIIFFEFFYINSLKISKNILKKLIIYFLIILKILKKIDSITKTLVLR
jgi:hypothetical protein